LRDYASAVTRVPDLATAVQGARTALTGAFDESVHDLLNERFIPLDHLQGLAPPTATAGETARQARLGERTASELANDLRVAAADGMAASEALVRAGHQADALRQAGLADLASFEAYLLEAAHAVGDTYLTTVDLRWDLATAAVGNLDLLDEDVPTGLARLREALVGVVGAAEAEALRATFEPVGPAVA
jgi:hypothetical protein